MPRRSTKYTKRKPASKPKTVDLVLYQKEPVGGGVDYLQGTINLGRGRFVTVRTFGDVVDIKKGKNKGKEALFCKAKIWAKR